MYLLVLKQLSVMMIIGICGFIFAKAFKCGDAEQKFLSKLLLYFINPCMVLNSFNRPFNSEKLKLFIFVVIISAAIHGLMIAVTFLLTLTKDPMQKDYNQIDRVAVVFTNCGFIGIPLINGVFGPDGVFYLMGYLVVFNIFLWTYGYYQIGGSVSFKKIITNPNIIAVTLGLILFCSPFDMPEFIQKPIYMIGELNTATAMILIGILFATFKLPSSVKSNSEDPEGNGDVSAEKKSRNVFIYRVVKEFIVRLVIMSILNLGVIILIYKIFGTLPDIRLIVFVIYICSMCPSATSVPSLACVFDKDTSYASLLVPLTSLGCIVTIPSFVALAELLIK